MDAITIQNLDVVFGQQQSQALALLDQASLDKKSSTKLAKWLVLIMFR
ncbi:L-proline glycine betaine ABC transport system permease protein ProV [Vibrio sp. JCM 18905]|nr:L-proline glycine betaine ABC transport system permease protein ProV [Vibrio sp. JCM 18905]